MKNFYNSGLRFKVHLKISTHLCVLFLGIFLSGNLSAQTAYKATGESNVSISHALSQFKATPSNSSLSAEASFIVRDGKLEGLKSFNLVVPSGYTLPGEDASADGVIKFELTHSMVLPVLKKVFLVGYLDMNNVSHRIDMEFNLSYNADKSISLSGEKKLKLSDYKDNKPAIYLTSYDNRDDLAMDMNFIFAKVEEPAPVVAVEKPSVDGRFVRAATR